MGYFVTLEGTEGSGKASQVAQLSAALQADGRDILHISLPHREQIANEIVQKYSEIKYMSVDELAFDLDKLISTPDHHTIRDSILGHLAKPQSVVIADSYLATIITAQGVKLVDQKTRREFYYHVLSTFYQKIGLPKAHAGLLLLMPNLPSTSDYSKNPLYTEADREAYEQSLSQTRTVMQNMEEIAELWPSEFTAIYCMSRGQTLSQEEIGAMVWEAIDLDRQTRRY